VDFKLLELKDFFKNELERHGKAKGISPSPSFLSRYCSTLVNKNLLPTITDKSQ
jgi:hypothetical protein